jgi:ribonuclease Y
LEPTTTSLLIGLLLGLVLGGGIAVVGYVLLERLGLKSARSESQRLVAAATMDAEALRRGADLAAKEEAFRRREEVGHELEQSRRLLRDEEGRLKKREDSIDEKLDYLSRKERDLESAHRLVGEQQEELARRQAEAKVLLVEQREELLRLGKLGYEEARETLFRRLEDELAREIGERIAKCEQGVKETAASRAREVLATAIQRYAAAHTAETTVSTIDIPSDDVKGRIIGREGRNIRAFEKATGVDVIVDDTPGIVVVTGFDNVRREVAKLALEKLIQDGRIHPTRIEEIVAETQQEMDAHILQVGSDTAREVEVVGLHEKLLHYLGRLRFRTSYSQNVLRHSVEVAFLTGMLAEEIGLNTELGRRCGLLHDIGKAADHEMEGGHPQIGADLCRRFGERGEVVHAALGHHEDLRVDRPYTVLVAAADAISASRPGARRDTLEKYVRRLEELEALASGFPGVEQAYAIQAGREVRILVNSAQLDDLAATKLCRDVARAVEAQLRYPGEVKITVLRETRVVDYAR